jgi:pentose-5-phosphate-3-epimerase
MLTPIIMESEISEVTKRLAVIHKQGEKRVHFDIGDGLFSEWLGVAPADLQGQDLGDLAIDFHLLVEDPTEYLEECVALKPARIIGQIERMGSQELFLETIVGYDGNIGGGLALAINTPVEEIEKTALKTASVILLLAVPAGTSGSNFEVKIIEKIRELRKIYAGSILIDGGVSDEIEKLVIEAGATEVGENSNYWKGKI